MQGLTRLRGTNESLYGWWEACLPAWCELKVDTALMTFAHQCTCHMLSEHHASAQVLCRTANASADAHEGKL